MVNVYALCGGLIDLDLSGFFSDRVAGTRATVPVICFLIAHPRGRILVDTGVHPQALTDPVGRLGEARASRFNLRSAPTDEVVSQLAGLGLGPDDVCVFGDMPNDVPMMNWARWRRVAVANAHPEVLAIADEVAASNDADGVASWLEALF